jgi:hypothetical protein
VFGHDGVDQFADARGLPNIELDAASIVSGLRQTANRAAKAFGIDVGQHDDGALLGEGFGHGITKSARGAGNERDLARQIE